MHGCHWAIGQKVWRRIVRDRAFERDLVHDGIGRGVHDPEEVATAIRNPQSWTNVLVA
jgi:hypothetical protein